MDIIIIVTLLLMIGALIKWVNIDTFDASDGYAYLLDASGNLPDIFIPGRFNFKPPVPQPKPKIIDTFKLDFLISCAPEISIGTIPGAWKIDKIDERAGQFQGHVYSNDWLTVNQNGTLGKTTKHKRALFTFTRACWNDDSSYFVTSRNKTLMYYAKTIMFADSDIGRPVIMRFRKFE